MKKHYPLFIIVLLLIIFAPARIFALTVDITATVPGCGDNIIEDDEQCDGSDFGGATCFSRGFSGGSLSCTSACTFDASGCTTGSFGGGSGSIGNGWIFSNINSIIVNQNGIITSGIPSVILKGIFGTKVQEVTSITTEEESHLFDVTLGPVQSTNKNAPSPIVVSIILGILISILALLLINKLRRKHQ